MELKGFFAIEPIWFLNERWFLDGSLDFILFFQFKEPFESFVHAKLSLRNHTARQSTLYFQKDSNRPYSTAHLIWSPIWTPFELIK